MPLPHYPLRVLFDIVAATDPLWGGLEEHVLTLGRHLAASGHEPLFLLRADYPAAARARLAAVGIRCLRVPGVLNADGRRPSLRRWLPALASAVRRERVDLVHLHSSLHGSELWGALAARLAGVPGVVCTYHCLLGPESPQRRLGMWGMHRLLGVRGIGVSRAVRALVRGRYRLPASYVACVPNGIDDVAEYVPPAARELAGHVTIAVVSRLSHEKGVDTFIEALGRVDRSLAVRAVVIGEGDQLEPLRRQVEELGLSECVEFRGFVAGAAGLLSRFDLVVVPSRTEGFGLLAAEACAASRPVIATRVGGLPDLVRHGENGWLVSADDPAAMARAIEAAARDPIGRRRMGMAGRQFFETELRAEIMAERTIQVYRAALATPSRARGRALSALDLARGGAS